MSFLKFSTRSSLNFKTTPYILPDHLAGEIHLQLLKDALNPALTDIITNDQQHDNDHLMF